MKPTFPFPASHWIILKRANGRGIKYKIPGRTEQMKNQRCSWNKSMPTGHSLVWNPWGFQNMDLSKRSGNKGRKTREKLSVQERSLEEGMVFCIWAGHKTKSTTSSKDVAASPRSTAQRESSDKSSQAGSRTRIRKALIILIFIYTTLFPWLHFFTSSVLCICISLLCQGIKLCSPHNSGQENEEKITPEKKFPFSTKQHHQHNICCRNTLNTPLFGREQIPTLIIDHRWK